jgi:hypothetical protein
MTSMRPRLYVIVLFIALETVMNAHNAHDRSVTSDATRQRQSLSTWSPSRRMPNEVRRSGINVTNLFCFWDWIGRDVGVAPSAAAPSEMMKRIAIKRS